MAITQNGNSITISNCTITVNNAFDPTTGAATITITPSGGLGTLPALLAGQAGPPPQWRNVNLTQIAYGTSLPTPAATVTQIAPGGPGTASVYDLNLNLNSGAPGSAGTFNIGSANDWSGSVFSGAYPAWNAGTSKFNPTAPVIGTYLWASSTNSTSGTGAGPRTLASISVSSQPNPWFVIPFAQTIVSGTVNTQVNLSANITTTGGNQVGIGYGVAGIANQNVFMLPAVPTGSGGTYPQIAASTSATIVFSATQVAATTDAWSTSSTTTSCGLLVFAV